MYIEQTWKYNMFFARNLCVCLILSTRMHRYYTPLIMWPALPSKYPLGDYALWECFCGKRGPLGISPWLLSTFVFAGKRVPRIFGAQIPPWWLRTFVVFVEKGVPPGFSAPKYPLGDCTPLFLREKGSPGISVPEQCVRFKLSCYYILEEDITTNQYHI